MSENVELLKRIYDRFKTWRQCSQPCTKMSFGQMAWTGAMSAGAKHYWTRQWAMVDPHAEPVAFAEGRKAEVIVEVHQVVRDLRGNLLADKMVGHIFRVEDGLVRRFDIRGT